MTSHVSGCVKDGLKMEKMSSVGSGDDSRVGKKKLRKLVMEFCF